MKTIAIIQARMGASRLPGKMLKDIAGKPAIAHVVERVKMAKHLDEVWVATTTAHADDAIGDWAAANSVSVYRGSEQDVLDRYYKTAVGAGADVIVRVTGDCPLADPQVIDHVIEEFGDGVAFDYISNVHPPTFPDGLDTEVFSFTALEKTWKEAKLSSEREHVTPYIWNHPELFRQKNIENDIDLSTHRWTLDTPEDLECIRLIVEACQKKNIFCGLKETLEIIHEHPEWQGINAKFERNEGYKKSVAAD